MVRTTLAISRSSARSLLISSEWRRLRLACEVVERVAIEQALRWIARSIRELRASLATRGTKLKRARKKERERGRAGGRKGGREGARFETRNLTRRRTQNHASGRATRYEYSDAGVNDITLCASRNVRATRGSPVPSCFSWRLLCRSVSAIFILFSFFILDQWEDT